MKTESPILLNELHDKELKYKFNRLMNAIVESVVFGRYSDEAALKASYEALHEQIRLEVTSKTELFQELLL